MSRAKAEVKEYPYNIQKYKNTLREKIECIFYDVLQFMNSKNYKDSFNFLLPGKQSSNLCLFFFKVFLHTEM